MKHPKILALALTLGLATGIAGCTPASNETEPSSSPTTATPTAPAPSTSHEHGDAVDDPAKIELAKQAATIMTTWGPEQGLQPYRRGNARQKAHDQRTG